MAEETSCYHCGLPIPDGVDLPVEIEGLRREMCCPGCQAVAQSIVQNGLADYYRNRDAMPESPREAVPAILDQLPLFDHADFQKSFVRQLDTHEREASLILEGITCAACIWLNEQHVGQLPGVRAVEINYATRRARVRWDEREIQLSRILAAIAAIGYRAYPYDTARHEQLAQQERREALWRVWVAGFGMMQVMMYAFPAYISDGELTLDIETLMRWASLLLTLPVVFYSAAPFFRNSWRDLKLRRVGMDVPVALGIGAAFLASCWATLQQTGEVYFDSVTMFVFFLLGGRYLEMTARQKAVGVTEALAKLLPAFAQKLPNFPVDRENVQCLVADLAVGDVVMLRPGEVVPADGVVIEGQSSLNEAMLTGESRPVAKTVGARLTGGTLNIESPLFMRVEHVGEETRLSTIVRLMERAAAERPKVVELADRVARYFVAILLLVSLAVALGWYAYDPDRALWITVSVLVVTCPCALSLATPIALTVAAGALARDGLLVTRGHAVETLANATHVVFDKTGTLTTGQMTLLDQVTVPDLLPVDALALAAALESASEHPLANAILRAGPASVEAATDVRAIPGGGIEGLVAGVSYRIGRPDFVSSALGATAATLACPWLDSGDTVIALGNHERVLAFFRIGDEIRPEAAHLIQSLKAAGRETILLSGDAETVVARVARSLGINRHMSEVDPKGKHDFVQRLQVEGAIVAMIGDGVNDAPVLAQAQVSVAMGGGAQLARTQADFVLLSDNLALFERAIRRARFSLLVIKQNLWWSFAYNVVSLPLAIAGFINPWLAGIGMSASSLLVVLNSLRIQTMKDH